MKKHILYSMIASAGLVLAGCNGDYTDWASPQSYDPEAAASTYGVTFAAGPEANLAMPSKESDVKVVTLTASSPEVKGFTLKKLTVNGEQMTGDISDNYITVKAQDLLKMAEQNFKSRAAVARSLELSSDVSLNLKSGDAVTGATGKTVVTVTPYATPAIDEKGYYMLGDFVGNGWNLATPIWMAPQGNGIYTATVNTNNEGSNWFKFYCGSLYSDSNWDIVNQGQMGCETNGDDKLENFLVYTGDPEYDGVQTPTITGQGTFEVTLDMVNLVYSVKRAEAQYYIVGNLTDPTWSADACKRIMFYAQGGNVYSYTTKWPGAWDLKFWSAKDIGNWDVAWGSGDGDGSPTGQLTNQSSGAFQSPTKNEYYTLTINMNSQTYEWTRLDNQEPTEYTAISLIGDFNGWSGDIDLAQEANAPHNWYGRATIPSDGGLKFRANHDWATSWGTSPDDEGKPIGDTYYLGIGEKNITVPAGTYDFYLNDITGRWSICPVE